MHLVSRLLSDQRSILKLIDVSIHTSERAGYLRAGRIALLARMLDEHRQYGQCALSPCLPPDDRERLRRSCERHRGISMRLRQWASSPSPAKDWTRTLAEFRSELARRFAEERSDMLPPPRRLKLEVREDEPPIAECWRRAVS